MNAVSLHDAFVGKGCRGKQAPTPAVTVEAGAMWIDVYDAVTTKAGRYVQGGGCTTVGVAGLVQSGGFGSMSKGFGTAAAGLLEAEIVTADGVVRTVNACSNPDLFWALKGGGGGSWGVVTKLTLRTHELPEFFGLCGRNDQGKVGRRLPAIDRSLRRLLSRPACSIRTGAKASRSSRTTPSNSRWCVRGSTTQQAAHAWQPFFDWAKAQATTAPPILKPAAGTRRAWWDVEARKKRGSDAMISDPRPGAPAFHAWWSGDQDQVSAYLHGYESLWLPAALLQSAEQAHLAGALFAASRRWEVELHFNKGLAGRARRRRSLPRATPPPILRYWMRSRSPSSPMAGAARAGATVRRGGCPPACPRGRRSGRGAAQNRAPSRLLRFRKQLLQRRSWQQAFWGSQLSATARGEERNTIPTGCSSCIMAWAAKRGAPTDLPVSADTRYGVTGRTGPRLRIGPTLGFGGLECQLFGGYLEGV